MRAKRLARAFAVSAALHLLAPAGVGAAVSGYPHMRRFFSEQATLVEGRIESWRIQRERQRLVDGARRDIRRGSFKLGDFMLRANALDSREKGTAMDFRAARERYRGLHAKLRGLLDSGEGLEYAIPETLRGEFRYLGHSQNSMAQMLEKGGGNCVPTAQLIASLAYDAGYHDIYLRDYPPNRNGLGHLAPIHLRKGVHYDLRDGDYAFAGGKQYHATLVPELYARRHGLAADLEGIADMGRGSYPGAAPLIARDIIGHPRIRMDDARPGARRSERPEDTIATWTNWHGLDLTDLIREEALSPMGEPMPEGIFLVSLERIDRDPREIRDAIERTEANLEWISRTISQVERVAQKMDPMNKGGSALAEAYLAGLYMKIEKSLDMGPVDDELSSLRDTAGREREAHAKRGAALLKGLRLGREIDRGFLSGMRLLNLENGERFQEWYLLFLGESGEEALMDIADERLAGTGVWISLLGNPSTHGRAAASFMRMSKLDQLRVLSRMEFGGDITEVSFGADIGSFIKRGDRDLYRIHKVLDGLFPDFHRYFDSTGGPPIGFREIQRRVHCECQKQGLDRGWEGVFLDYFAEREILANEVGYDQPCRSGWLPCNDLEGLDRDFLQGYLRYRREEPLPSSPSVELRVLSALDGR